MTMISKTKPCFGIEEMKQVFGFSRSPIKRFEEQFAKVVGSRYAVSFAYGRTGIHALLSSQGIAGKEVIIPAYTCIVVPNAVVSSGNKPVFADISLKEYNIDLNNLRISPKTSAIIATHMYGYPADIKKIRKIVGKKVFIIEDAALAVLTKDVGRYSDACVFSFNIAKQLCTIDGCVVTTNRQDVYEKLRKFKETRCKKAGIFKIFSKYLMFLLSGILFNKYVYGGIYRAYYSNKKARSVISNWDVDKIEMPTDYLEDYTNVQARIGLAQLKSIEDNIKKRIRLAMIYDYNLRGLPGITPAPIIAGASYSHYTIRVKSRVEFIRKLEKCGLPIGKSFDFDYSIPFTSAYSDFKQKGVFRNSSTAAKEVVNLPFRPNLSKKEVEYILNTVRKVANNA